MKALVLHSLFEVHAVLLVADDFDATEAKNVAEYYNQSAKLVDLTACPNNDEVIMTIRELNGEVREFDDFIEFTELVPDDDLTTGAFQDFISQNLSLDVEPHNPKRCNHVF